MASGSRAVLRGRRPGRRRRLPVDAGHDDARSGALSPRVGLGPEAGPHDHRWDAVPHRHARPDRGRDRARGWPGGPVDGELLRRAPCEADTAASSSTATTRRSRSAVSRTSMRPSRSARTGRSTSPWPTFGRPIGGPPGRAAWLRWRPRSPRADHIARPPTRPPTSSISSRRPARPWRMAGAGSRSLRRSRRRR